MPRHGSVKVIDFKGEQRESARRIITIVIQTFLSNHIGVKAHDERVHDHRVRSTNKPVHMKRQACRDFTDLDLHSTVLFGVVSAFTRSHVTEHFHTAFTCTKMMVTSLARAL